uniref:Uncharacterized protein n=1 Tax=Arion vulgaris TaxID=1028688 RepID=A0A0B6YW28_9EUPU
MIRRGFDSMPDRYSIEKLDVSKFSTSLREEQELDCSSSRQNTKNVMNGKKMMR